MQCCKGKILCVLFMLFFLNMSKGNEQDSVFSFKWFTVKDGLPSPFINDIYED